MHEECRGEETRLVLCVRTVNATTRSKDVGSLAYSSSFWAQFWGIPIGPVCLPKLHARGLAHGYQLSEQLGLEPAALHSWVAKLAGRKRYFVRALPAAPRLREYTIETRAPAIAHLSGTNSQAASLKLCCFLSQPLFW